jgi:PAS domain S-box-containing protein
LAVLAGLYRLRLRHLERQRDAIRKSEKELRDGIDSIPAMVWSTLPDGSNTYVNKRFVEYTGSSAEQMAGSRWQALVHPDDLERHAAKWTEALATGKPHENEVRSRRSDGQYRWQLDCGLPLRGEDGNIVKWYGVTTDIEDRKRADEALQKSQFYLAEGQRLADVGSWAFNPSGFFEYWSQELFKIYGMDPQKGVPTLEQHLATVDPQDRDFIANKENACGTQGLRC